MQNFAKKKLALAIGASLMTMAGVAQAVLPTGAPTARATNPALISNASSTTDARGLYDGSGYNGSLTVTLTFDAPNLTITPADGKAAVTAGADGIKVNSGLAAGAAPAPTVDDISVYTVSGTTNASLVTANVGFTQVAVGPTNAIATFDIASGAAPAAFRMSAAGALEWIADIATAAVAANWLPVKYTVNAVAASGGNNNAITAQGDGNNNTTADSTPIVAIAAANIGNAVIPAPIVTTRATAGLVDGVVYDTLTPLSVAFGTANVAATTAVQGDVDQAVALPVTVAAATSSAVAGATSGASRYPIVITTPAAADWTSGSAAADAAAYASPTFHTGIEDADMPFIVGTVTAPTYQKIYTVATGAAASAADIGDVAVEDGAAPVLMSAVTQTAGQPDGTSMLTLSFSEVIEFIAGGAPNATDDDLREVAENVKLGADTLAALNLNADGQLDATVDLVDGQGVLNITGIQTADLSGKQVTVTSGITIQEQNDPGFSATVASLDDAGVYTDSGITLETLSAAATSTTAAAITIDFTDDTSASAATTVADTSKVGSIVVKFAAGKEVALGTSKTLANLASDLVVVVNGLNGQTPVTFNFYPVAANLTLNADGNTLTIALPTSLVYANIDSVTTMDVIYDTTNVADVLVSKTDTTNVIFSGITKVKLPLSAGVTSGTLLTQSIVGTLSGASNGSLMHAWLAKWNDKPATPSLVSEIVSGKITNPGDKVATDLAIEFADKGDLESLIAEQLNAVAAAAPAVAGVSNAVTAVAAASIPVYVKLIRSNDTAATAAQNNSQNYLNAHAILATTFEAAEDEGDNSNDQESPIYEVLLDPKTGKISGRLTGDIKIKSATDEFETERGFALLGEVAQGLVDATGKFNLLAGIDEVTSADLAKGIKSVENMFLILVHEDQSNDRRYTQLTSANPDATNYLAFTPNLASLKGTRTTLGVAPGIAGPIAETAAASTAVAIALSNYKVVSNASAFNWQLVPVGNPAVETGKAPLNFARSFVGLDKDAGFPFSYWVNDSSDGDMALAMAGNKAGVATELAADDNGNAGDTLSNITAANFVAGAVAFAWHDDNDGQDAGGGQASHTLTFAQTAAPATPAKLVTGWSLVTVPAAGLTAATVDAVIRVGAQASSQLTWIKADDATATPLTSLGLTAGEPVFVYSKAGGNL